jgi:hypothetical protein
MTIMVEGKKKYGPQYIVITIRTTDGSTLQGKVNISAKKRVSDLFTDSSEQFVVMVDVSSQRGDKKTLIVNKNHIVWVEPEEELGETPRN